MPQRFLLLACCLAVAAFCARLGVWQLDRLGERRAANDEIRAGLTLAPVDVAALPGGKAPLYQRVRAEGAADYTREIVLAPRARLGSPGVHVVTPLVRPDTDTLLLAVRGWVYSPDALTVDLTQWREGDSLRIEGYALPLDTTGASDSASARSPNAVRRLDRARLEARLGAPVEDYYVVITSPPDSAAAAPPRLDEPTLGDGPHLSYAVQWFVFAAVFGLGGAIVVFRGQSRPARVARR